MKAILVKNPWAEWVRRGSTTMRALMSKTDHRGKLLLCTHPELDLASATHNDWTRSLPYGKAVAVLELIDCRNMVVEDMERAGTSFRKGACVWVFDPVKIDVIAEPFDVKTDREFFQVDLPDDIAYEF